MSNTIELKKEELKNERENLRSYTIAEINAENEKAAKFTDLKTQSAARIKELSTEIEELIENSQKSESETESNSNAKENRIVVQFTAAFRKVPSFTYDVNTTEWCANIAKLQQIHAGDVQSEEIKHAFYQTVCGLINTVAFNSWNQHLNSENKIGNTSDLLMFLEEHYGDKTTIYQSLLELWSMKKESSSSFTETAHVMEYKLQKAMVTIKKTYKRIRKSELTVEAFSNIVAGMVYSELARDADPEVFRHATKDLEECFSPSEIATKLKFYQDQFGKSDAVTTAEKAAANTFYGSNPKVSNSKAMDTKKRSNGRGRGRGRGNNRNHRGNYKGDNKTRNADRCQYQDMPKGCMRSNCEYRHDSPSGNSGNTVSVKQRPNTGNVANDGNNIYHAQPSSQAPQSMTSSPAMMSHVYPMSSMTHSNNSMFSNGPDADFHSC